MKQTKALQNPVVSMTHPCVVCQSKKIALYVVYLLSIRRQSILYSIYSSIFFKKKLYKFTFFLNLDQKNMQ